MKMNVTLEANDQSSRRTRNRIQEHGPDFRVVKSGNCSVLGDGLHWLVRAESGWWVWLPHNEFRFFTMSQKLRAPLPAITLFDQDA